MYFYFFICIPPPTPPLLKNIVEDLKKKYKFWKQKNVQQVIFCSE